MKKVTFVVIGKASDFNWNDARSIQNKEFNLGNLDMAEVNMAVKLRNILSEETLIQDLKVMPLAQFMEDWNYIWLDKPATTIISYIHAIIEDKIKDEDVNVAYGEAVVNAIEEEEFEKCADLITQGSGDIVGFNPRRDRIEELLEQLEGNTSFLVVDEKDLAEINKFL